MKRKRAGIVRTGSPVVASERGSGPGVATMGGDVSGVGGGAAPAPGSGSRSGSGANGSPFFTGTNSATLGNHGCTGAASSMGGFPLDFSGLIPPFVRPQSWDTDPRPPGGFMSFFHNQPQQSHSPNFHHVGAPSHWVPLRTPRQVDVASDSHPVTPTAHQSTENLANRETVNVDNEDETVRTEKRILWTPDEDRRLMSAWLNNSVDPISGNDKRNEQYWADVANTYNLTTPKQRKRNMKQAKDRWHKINKWTDLFHSAWLKAQLVYCSGHSEQDWIDKAHKFYLADNTDLKLGPFVLMDVWYAVRNESKWVTYNKGLKKARKRKESGKEETSDKIDDDERPLRRPIGQKKAKQLLYEGKSVKSAIDIDELEKFEKIQSDAHTNRLKVLEIQQKLSAEKMESSKLAHLAAMEQKEARKLELDARMMEIYTHLLKQDQGRMSDQEKADHIHTLKRLKKRFPETT